MFFNLLSNNEKLEYDITLAKKIGLGQALYISMLAKEMSLQNTDTIILSREDIYNKTAIKENKQTPLEDSLIDKGWLIVLECETKDAKKYTLSKRAQISLLLQIFDEVEYFIEEAQNLQPRANLGHLRASYTNISSEELKKCIKTPILEAKKYLNEWVDTLIRDKKFLNAKLITQLEDELYTYANRNESKFIKLCQIALEERATFSSQVKKAFDKKELRLNDISQIETTQNIEQIKNNPTEKF